MTRLRLPTLVLLATLLCWSHATPEVLAQDRQSRDVEAFTNIGFAISGTLYISQGETHSVEIDADDEILEYIETVVNNGRLHIRGQEETGWFSWLRSGTRRSATADVYVTTPSLDGVSVAGSGDVIVRDTFTSDRFSVEIAGSGNIELPLEASAVTARIAGSGSMNLSGMADDLSVNIAGSGDVRASDLQVARAEVRIAGSGDCHVYAREHLNVQIMGSGDVFYAGEPEIERSVMGSGRVRAID